MYLNSFERHGLSKQTREVYYTDRDGTPKKVIHYKNQNCPQSCLVQLYKLIIAQKMLFSQTSYCKIQKWPVWYQWTAYGHSCIFGQR